MRPEEKIEKKFAEECNNIGVRAVKLEVNGDKGWPDRMVVMPAGKIIFIEFKRPLSGVVSIHQEIKINWLQSLGHSVYVFDNWEQPLEIVKNQLAEIDWSIYD